MTDGFMGGENEIAEYEKGGAPWCITYTFMPNELEGLLRRLGVKNIEMADPGAYRETKEFPFMEKRHKKSFASWA